MEKPSPLADSTSDVSYAVGLAESAMRLAKPAGNWDDGKAYLERLLAEGELLVKSGIEAIGQLPGAVRKTLQDRYRQAP
jgi:hypothetical protein